VTRKKATAKQTTRKHDVAEATAFIQDSYTDDELAEHLGELTVATATCGEDRALRVFDDNAPEDMVSPFGTAGAIEDDEAEE